MRFLIPGFVLAGFAIVPLHAVPVLDEMGSLQQMLENEDIPSEASSDKYRLPTDDELAAFRLALQHILDGDLQAAADEAVDANYEVVDFEDTDTNDGFVLLREKSPRNHRGGLYAIDTTPERAMVVQCPHPLFDGVRAAAADIFIDTDSVAYLQAGTHRNNSPTESDCDGDLGGDPYRISDMAHQPDGFFQAAHEVIEAHFDRAVSLSFHGMADDTDPADVVVSNGSSHEFVGNSLSRNLATRMNEILDAAADPREAVSHQEPGENPALSGSTNTQGRATNGSDEPCMTPASTAIFPERFIHMECAPNVRDGAPANWAFVTQALNELLPLFSDPVPDLPTGDIVITEIMPNPNQVGDGTGEYLELFNHTGAPIDMAGWTIADRQGNSAKFSGIIQPGDLFVVGTSGDLNGAAPGGMPDAVWVNDPAPLTLTNTGDTISLIDANGNLVAAVTYGNVDGIEAGGTAFEIAVANAHPDGQATPSDLIPSTTAFGADLGSPGTRGDSQFPLPDPRPGASINNTDLSIHFNAALAVTYALWDSPDLDDWGETPGEDNVIGAGAEASFDLSLPNDPARFYRLVHDYAAPE